MYVVAALGMAFYVHHDGTNDTENVQGIYAILDNLRRCGYV